MKQLSIILMLFMLTSCMENQNKNMDINLKDEYGIFDKENHLQPEFEKTRFDTLHNWDFGWGILSLVNLAKSDEPEKELSRQFSPGQKALYFFWYLDAQVTNGGFIQFYENGYRHYLPTIMKGLELVGDKELFTLLGKADKAYLSNINNFKARDYYDDNGDLYDNLKEFYEYDETYYNIHDRTMDIY